jgi:hypothetical protein
MTPSSCTLPDRDQDSKARRATQTSASAGDCRTAPRPAGSGACGIGRCQRPSEFARKRRFIATRRSRIDLVLITGVDKIRVVSVGDISHPEREPGPVDALRQPGRLFEIDEHVGIGDRVRVHDLRRSVHLGDKLRRVPTRPAYGDLGPPSWSSAADNFFPPGSSTVRAAAVIGSVFARYPSTVI